MSNTSVSPESARRAVVKVDIGAIASRKSRWELGREPDVELGSV